MQLSESSLQACAEWLMYDEGYEQFAYDDESHERIEAPKGRLTIGIGFNIQDTGLSMVECILILKNRINIINTNMPIHLPTYQDLDEVRQSAVINMVYNLGMTGFLEFKDFIIHLAVKDYVNASKALLDSMAAVKEHNRYERISDAILTGKFPNVIHIDSDHF